MTHNRKLWQDHELCHAPVSLHRKFHSSTQVNDVSSLSIKLMDFQNLSPKCVHLVLVNHNCNELITIFPYRANFLNFAATTLRENKAIGMLQARCMDANDP